MTVTIFAGVPTRNMTLYHATRFLVGDPCALIEAEGKRTLIIRDIEMDRARRHARADRVTCPADWTPDGGLSNDRETAMAQALAECLRRSGVAEVRADRTLSLSYVDQLARGGVRVVFDPNLGVEARRRKDESEIEQIREAQLATERAVRIACETIARATADAGGVLHADGSPLTSERVRTLIDRTLLDQGYDGPPAIVACGSQGGDCHDHGHGPLMTGQPVIVDVFPKNKATLYNGDCTRTVVHGEISPELLHMHACVVRAKAAAAHALRGGTTAHEVHAATMRLVRAHGFDRALPAPDAPPQFTSLQHGTGHGLGLEGHEPPLIDEGGPLLIPGDVVTIEPGLYSRAFGGVRVEDVYALTKGGHVNLGGSLHEGLTWR